MKDNMALKTIKGSLKESDCENVYIVTGQGFSWRTERKKHYNYLLQYDNVSIIVGEGVE